LEDEALNRRIVIVITENNGEFKAEISPDSDDELLPEELIAAIYVLSENHNQVSDTHYIHDIARLEL
jgi:hypothetical protein